MSNNHCIREALELQCNNLETEAERLQASLDAIATILPNWRESEAKFWERLQTIAAEAVGRRLVDDALSGGGEWNSDGAAGNAR